jgi:MFS family permease
VTVASAAQPGAAGRHHQAQCLAAWRLPGPAITCKHELMAKDPTAKAPPSTGARWSIVIVSLVVTASSFLFINGVAFLIPALETPRGTPLTEASLLSSMPSWGMVVTLVAWGYVLDHVGERIVMTVGSALTAAAAYAASSVHSMVWLGVYLFLGGMAAASCNGAGGRLVSGWFPPHQRGLAMGIRQTAQPLGIALGALVMPQLAERGPHVGLMVPAVACAVAAVLSIVGVVDPPRKSRKTATHEELASPYRGSFVLWRIHAVSSLLMMPQTVTVTFMLVWLIRNDGWSIVAAGGVMTVSQLLGALGRIMVGRWSDRIGSRMQPVALIATAAAVTLFLLAYADHRAWRSEVALMVVVSVIAVLDNGLEATAITEFAGPFWSGRALGIQNTTQHLMAAAGPPLFGALISAAKYPTAWALCELFPLAAVPLVPVRLLPPGLETTAQRQSVRRLRWWQAVRSAASPNRSRRHDPPGQRRRPRQGGQAASPPT